MAKESKTNAMRILEKNKIPHKVNQYKCDECIDGIHIADMLGQSSEMSFKTIVTVGKSGNYYVFVLPVNNELDLKKAAKTANEKNIELLPIKDINKVTGYIRGGCTPIGMKKQYPTIIHESALEHEEIIISGGKLGEQILLSPKDLLSVTKGMTADVIQKV